MPLISDNPYADDPFDDLIRAQSDLEDHLEITRRKEIPIYLTGTYSPTYLGAATPGTTTYSIQVGAWIRIGNLIIATATIVWTAATGTGDAQFSLPFTAGNISNRFFSGGNRIETVTFANSAPGIQLSPNTSYMRLLSPITNAAGTFVQMEATGNVVYTVTYFL